MVNIPIQYSAQGALPQYWKKYNVIKMSQRQQQMISWTCIGWIQAKKSKRKINNFFTNDWVFRGNRGQWKTFESGCYRKKNPCLLHFWWRPLLFFSSYYKKELLHLPQISCSFLLNEARGTKGGNLGFLWYFPSLNATSKDPKRVQWIVYLYLLQIRSELTK